MGDSGREATLGAGSRVGNLAIERELGRGGFASVYLARDAILDRPVALKVLTLPHGAEMSDEQREAFLAEARIVGGLQSPHIVTLFHVHQHTDAGWMIEMEYVEGGSLADRLTGEPQAPRFVAGVLDGVLRGLAVAHERGVLHRDVKPGNVLLGPDGVAKLADFGTALVVGDRSFSTHPEHLVVGTPWYMAPEVLLGEKPSPATDLWSVGVLAYELLVGRLPFPQEDLPSLFYAVQNARIPDPPASLPRDLLQVIRRCMVRRREDRAQSAEDLLRLVGHPSMSVSTAVLREGLAGAVSRALVGREPELRAVERVLDALPMQRPQAWLLTGDAGIGKSDLLAEVRARAHVRDVLWIDATASSLDGAWRPVATALAALIREDTGLLPEGPGPASEFAARLRADEDVSATLPIGQLARGVESVVRALCERHAVCIAVDDAHLAERSEAELFGHLLRRVRPASLLVVLSARTGWPGVSLVKDAHHDVTHTPLAGLSRDALYDHLSRHGEMPLPAAVAARIAAASDGNPLFADLLLEHLVASGALDTVDGRIVAKPGWETVPLPAQFHDAASRRLDGLDESERGLLEIAAVDGREFDGKALAAVSGEPVLEVLRRLQRLSRRRGLLEPSDSGYRFRSSMLQATLYEEMAPELCEALHRALAEHLESRDAGAAPERLARHWESCGEPERAIPHLLEAARGAWRREETARLMALVTRIGLTADDVDRNLAMRDPRLTIHISIALREAGSLDDADRLLDVLAAGAAESGDPALALSIDVQRAVARSRASPSDESLETLRRGARECTDPNDAGRASYVLGMYAKRGGRLPEARAHLERARDLFEQATSARLLAAATDQLGSVALRSGDAQTAERLYDEAAEMSDGLGRRGNAAVSRVNGALAALQRGRLDAAAATIRRAITTFDVEGIAQNAAHARAILAQILYAQGDSDAAIAALRAAVPELERTEHRWGLLGALSELGEILAVRGDLDDANAALLRAEEIARDLRADGSVTDIWARRTQILCLEGRLSEASELARRALDARRATEQEGAGLVMVLAESILFGLPAEALSGADALLDRTDGHAHDLAQAFLRGSLAFVGAGGTTGPLHDAADALRGPRVATRRATLRAVADWIECEALRRVGDAAGALTCGERAARAAERLGHVWLEAAVGRLLARFAPDTAHARRASELVTRVVDRLSDDMTRERVRKEWLAGDDREGRET